MGALVVNFAPSLEALAGKIRLFPAGTLFRYCPLGDDEDLEKLRQLLAPRTLNVDSTQCPGAAN